MYDKIICLGYFPVPHNRIEGRQKYMYAKYKFRKNDLVTSPTTLLFT